MADEWEDWGTSNASNTSNTNASNYSSNHYNDSSKGTSYDKRKYSDDSSNDRSGLGRGRAKRMNNEWGSSSADNNTQSNTNNWANNDQNNSWSNHDNRNNDSYQNRSSYRDSSNKRVIKVLSSFVGKVIGRGGQTIKDLSAKSGARININKNTSDYETDIDLFGTDEQCDRAQQLINDLVGNSGNNSSFGNSSSQSTKKEEVVEEFIDWGAAIKESEEATKQKWAALAPIQKSFYFECNEIQMMSDEQVAAFRLKNNNIMISHFDSEDTRRIPNPVQHFHQAFQHYPEILREIEKQGFETPSPIQTQSWPILLQGNDLIGIAQTGTGKTLAYLLPAMIHIDNQIMKRSERPGPTALILAPTRELAQQIEKEAQKYRYKDIKCVCIYGGGDRNKQINCVGKGVEIVIATPGRLNDLCMNRHIDLTSVSYLVLDEADRMLDMGFEPQIKKVMLDIRPERHTVMMSATWPATVRRLAVNYMKNPMQVFVGTLDLAAVHSVTQRIIMCDAEEKRNIMYDFIRNMEPNHKVIIFLGKKALADDLASDCVLKGINCQSIHGDRDQHDREQALEDIRIGSVNILFATDVASRGLDIEDITHIFNFDFPRNVEEYVHRVGRTGRAGRSGESITLVTREDWKHANELINILSEAQQEVPEDLISMAERYTAWKAKYDAEIAACGGRRGGRGGRGGGGGGGFGGRSGGGFRF